MNVLEATNLRKSFGAPPKVVEAVKGVSLSIRAGEILAFLGHNGAGKTTTIKMIAGLILPDSGEVLVNGRNSGFDAAVYKEIGTVLEGSRNLYLNLSARENLEYWGVTKGLSIRQARQRCRELLAGFGLADRANTRVQDLSRGMQQKVAVAVSLLARPKLLLLDEPTLGLDVEASEAIKQRLRELAGEGCAILLTTHQLDVAQAVADRVAIIREGQIVVSDRTDSLLKRFSGDSYTVEVDGELSSTQVQALNAAGATIEGRVITVLGKAGDVYAVLDIVRGLPLVKAARTELDLTAIFLKINKEGLSC